MKKLLLVIATVATTLWTWALFLAAMCLIANEPQRMFGCALLMMGFDAAAKYFKVHDDRIATEPRGSLGTTRVSECSEAELGLRIFAILLLVAGVVVIALWAWGL